MIIFENVTKTYDKSATPVNHFSMHINEGQTAVLKGESGCGKSTILSLAAALTRPTSGSIIIDGKPIAKLPEHLSAIMRRDNIGIIFQSFHLIPSLTVLENVTVPLLPTGRSMKEINKEAEKLLDKLGIAGKRDMNVTKLSGGEQQRTAIARALINNPKIILADEPTANLDRDLTDSVIDIFRNLAAEGRTILIATHDLVITESGIADTIIDIGRNRS